MTFRSVGLAGAVVILLLSTAVSGEEPTGAPTIIKYGKQGDVSAPQSEESVQQLETAEVAPVKPTLGSAEALSGPGWPVANTWYEYQQNGSMGRMIDWSYDPAIAGYYVHFSWMELSTQEYVNRQFGYASFDMNASSMSGESHLLGSSDYGGYVNIDVRNDSKAIVGGHNNDGTETRPTFYQQAAPGFGFFDSTSVIPDSVMGGLAFSWPKFRYVEGPNDTVLHVVALTTLADVRTPYALYYFRKVGGGMTSTWDVAATRAVDTIFTISPDIAATDDGKVAMVWTANLPSHMPDEPPECDTCSFNGGRPKHQMDNDVYYQMSNDYGVTWQPRVNLTKYYLTDMGPGDSYRAYTDLSTMFDPSGYLHIVWNARRWTVEYNIDPSYNYQGGRIFHWSNGHPFITVVHDFDWGPTCTGGGWQLYASKMSISHCNGRLYVLFVQFNDGHVGITDDCSGVTGIANGDLYVTTSGDALGATWTVPINITNTRSPGCDDNSTAGCPSESWPSVARFGNVADDYGVATVIDPTGNSNTAFHLEVQYIDDPSPGGYILNEGVWKQASLKWFRMKCYGWTEPLDFDEDGIADVDDNCPYEPNTDQANTDGDSYGDVCDNCPSVANEDQKDNDWDGVGEVCDNCPSVANPGQEDADSDGRGDVCDNCPTIANWDQSDTDGDGIGDVCDACPNDPLNDEDGDGFCADVDNCPTIANPGQEDADGDGRGDLCDWGVPGLDTISTSCSRLVLSSSGNYGNEGDERVNFDFADFGDCDPGATVYIYDGSPFVVRFFGDAIFPSISMYGGNYLGWYELFPDDEGNPMMPVTVGPGYETFNTGTIITELQQLKMERIWWAPANPDSCEFMIQCLKVYAPDGVLHTGIVVGEIIDWDIPSDVSVYNTGGAVPSENLIYLQGIESDGAGCQPNNYRYGGLAMIGYHTTSDTTMVYTPPYSAHTEKFDIDPVNNIFEPGFNPDTTQMDQRLGMTYMMGTEISSEDTMFIYSVVSSVQSSAARAGVDALISNIQAGKQWFENHIHSGGCCALRGDFNDDGLIKVSDLTALIAYLFRGGPAPACLDHGDTNGDGDIKVSDLTLLIAYLFRGGTAPVGC